jgi:cell division septum initiation protein DivIVA
VEILDLINQLETLAGAGKKLPMGRKLVEADRLLELVDQMRLAVPRAVQEADEVLDKREQILTQSDLDSKRIRAAAETEARNRLEESEIVKAGKKHAQEIIAESQAKAGRFLEQAEIELRQRRDEADQYSAKILQGLEEEVGRIHATIQRGLDALDHRRPQAHADEEAAAIS